MNLRTQGLPVPDIIDLPPKYISQLEFMVKQALESSITEYTFRKVRPSWLTNPRTGHRLELDFYCEELKLAIEVQGQQHYFPIEKFHKNPQEFEETLYRDQVKRDTCAKLGIVLYEHKYNERIDILVEMVQLYIDCY